jgi:hypothetical protein
MSPSSTARSEYSDYLKEKRRRLIALSEAEQARSKAKLEYNLIDIDEEIRQFETNPPPHGLPTVEDLTRASKHVQNLETQIESLDQMVNQPGIGESMRPLIEGMLRPMFVSQLETATEYRTRVQNALEETPQEAGN